MSEILTSVNSVYPPDLVLVTGALVSRDSSLTLAQRTTSFDTTLNLIKTKFATVPIIAALGNTEFSGTNSQSFSAKLLEPLPTYLASITNRLGSLMNLT